MAMQGKARIMPSGHQLQPPGTSSCLKWSFLGYAAYHPHSNPPTFPRPRHSFLCINLFWVDLTLASEEAIGMALKYQNTVPAHAVAVAYRHACYPSHSCTEGRVSHVQPIKGERADEIAHECPGLFEVKGEGESREAKANSAREHPKLLEKVLLVSSLVVILQ